ncbi:phage gp6-like head-tail connector protein [Mesorhizobium sp. B2-6-3]|uniref:head-tail connector protein n=1 Tax=Mesorhizobium sp. B2-6-3 TaxID=2589914 RepID=UPI00112BC9E7|nr:head-tail connector protein [Mesorhizobium sp. B2-6-3]TPJ76197.1 phage gp6-like head-tail connector protein [Mesorhizobium sp. B2-6-3]
MVALVTLETVKERLRIDTTDDDGALSGYIESASAAVINYLKGQAEVLLDLDSGGELPSGVEVPPLIATATVILVGYWYRNPDSDPDKDFEMGYLPKPVTALLYPLRDPALA